MPDVFRPPPRPTSSSGGLDSGITHGLLGLGDDVTDTIDPNQVPSDFNTYIQVVLWKEGVDISRMDKAQYAQLAKSLWQDQFLQDQYNTTYGGSYTSGAVGHDPETGAPLTDSNFESAIRYELFDPTRTHSQFLVCQGVSLEQRA